MNEKDDFPGQLRMQDPMGEIGNARDRLTTLLLDKYKPFPDEADFVYGASRTEPLDFDPRDNDEFAKRMAEKAERIDRLLKEKFTLKSSLENSEYSPYASLIDNFTEIKPIRQIREYNKNSYDYYFEENDNYSYEKYDYKGKSLSRSIGGLAVDSLMFNNISPRDTVRDERTAHKYRSQKLRFGPLGDFVKDFLIEHPDIKKGVSAITKRASKLMERTQSGQEKHRLYAPLISGIMNEPEARAEFMDRLDEAATQKSDELKKEALTEGEVIADIVIIGAGVHSAIFAARVRAENPELRIVVVDEAEKLGGQFRSYGDRPVFSINSRNHRSQKNEKLALPGKDGNLNSFGDKAPIQLTDISAETYPTNVELGDVTAINSFMSSDAMLGVSYMSNVRQTTTDETTQLVTVSDGEQTYNIRANQLVIASGIGEREIAKKEKPKGVWTAEDLFSHFGNSEITFPMDEFVGKRIMIKGGGDTGRVVAELFARLAPKEAYGKSNVQLGGPREIIWYGADFDSKEDFQRTNRPRYQRLAPFIRPADTLYFDDKTDEQTFLIPSTDKVISIDENAANGDLEVTTIDSSGFRDRQTADIVIDCTNLSSDIFELFKDQGAIENSIGFVPELDQTAEVAKKIGPDITFIGPVAKLPLTRQEKQTFADGISENTVAIWANQLRTNVVAKQMAQRLSRAKTKYTTRNLVNSR